MSPDNPIKQPDDASGWMHRGIDLLRDAQPAALWEAIRCFDEAIVLRRRLPLENPRHRYALAAGWMNRGDALARLGGDAQRTESVKSYDEALHLLGDLPLADDPLYPRRLAIAWINRGCVRQRETDGPAQTDAVHCFREAIATLENSASAEIPDLDLLRAGALTNLAGALLDSPNPSPLESRAAAHRALYLSREQERGNATAAETGLKARHVLCRGFATESRDDQAIPPRSVGEATDAVDEGLALARFWEQRGEDGFREMAADLFRFGCRIYQIYQPHFLTEFILESFDPASGAGVSVINHDTHAAALAGLWNVLKELQRDGFQSLSGPDFARLLENLRDLRVAEQRLEQLNQVHLQTPKTKV